jgi:hypothetical protein
MKLTIPHPRALRRRSRGQILMVVVVVMVVLLVFAFFLFDLQGIVRLRARTQNGVDAAALAGASWQGRTLNMIGELNLLKATTAMLTAFPQAQVPDDEAATLKASSELMTQMQGRLSYVGPLMGLAAAQQAAKENGMRSVGEYTGMLEEHLRDCFNDTGDGAWYENVYGNDPDSLGFNWVPFYGSLLSGIVSDGIAANPVNPHLLRGVPQLNGAGGSLLANPEFYDAVYGCDFCWFYRRGIGPNHGPIDLSGITYSRTPQAYFPGSEFLPLYIDFAKGLSVVGRSDVAGLLAERGQEELPADQPGLDEVRWAVYQSDWNQTANYDFVNKYLRSNFRQEYTYGGACARFITLSTPQYVSQKRSWKYGDAAPSGSDVTSVAAAKPFGSIGGAPPQSTGIVLPVFTETRLIPVALVTASAFSEIPDFYKFIVEYFGHPDYPNVPPELKTKYNHYLEAINRYNDPSSAFNTSWQRYDTWRTKYMAGSDGILGTADDRRDPCTPVFTGGGGGGGGSSGGPGIIH